MTHEETIKGFLEFYTQAEKLKVTLRHSWLSNPKRQESTAEHSWMVGLLAIVLSGELETKVNVLKVLKMAIVHDLAESITGDIPSFEDSKRKKNKHQAELKALKKLTKNLSPKIAAELLMLWEECEQKETLEAKFVQSLDKLEAVMQHNTANISTWQQGDYDIQPYYRDHLFNFDTFIRKLKDQVDIDTMKKIIKAKLRHRIDPIHYQRFKTNKKS